MTIEEARKLLLSSIASGDQKRAEALIAEWARHSQFRSVLSDLLEPVLEEIGNLWDAEKISLAAGYLAGKIAEGVLMQALQAEQAISQTKGPVILGNVEDDFHSLGRKLVSIFLRTAGWKVVDLGNDVLAADFVDAALANDSRVIAASAMMFTTAENIKKIRSEIDHRGLQGRIKLAVGGAVFKFRPELVAEVGGDGTATNAVEAPLLIERLWKEGENHDPS